MYLKCKDYIIELVWSRRDPSIYSLAIMVGFIAAVGIKTKACSYSCFYFCYFVGVFVSTRRRILLNVIANYIRGLVYTTHMLENSSYNDTKR